MTTFYWHIHHDTLCEPLTDPLENLLSYIKSEKPEDEIETRLRLIKPVKGKLPEEWMDARAAYVQAWKVRGGRAWAAYVRAWKVCDQAGKVCKPQIEALHKIECPDCPWNGSTIFPKNDF